MLSGGRDGKGSLYIPSQEPLTTVFMSQLTTADLGVGLWVFAVSSQAPLPDLSQANMLFTCLLPHTLH